MYNTHHKRFIFTDKNGNICKELSTRLSHSNKKDYNDKLLNSIKKQLKLDNKNQVEDLINCPLSEDEYRKIVNPKVNSNLI